jgi:hypothetical protein
LQQTRPGGEVGKIEERVRVRHADLLGNNRGILGAGPARNNRSNVAKYGGAKLITHLCEVLVPDCQGERVFSSNLSKGRLGEGTAHLLGALITTAIAQAALSRADLPAADRRVFAMTQDGRVIFQQQQVCE